MTAQTLEDILITDKEVSGYMDTRDTGEHLKIKKPTEYINEVEKYFSDDLTGGLELPFPKTAADYKVRMGEISFVHGFFWSWQIGISKLCYVTSNETREDYDCFF